MVLLYAMRVLRNHGLPATSLTDVFRATIIANAKLTYCLLAWSGLTSAHDRTRIDPQNATDTVLIAFSRSLTFSLKLTNLSSDEYSTMNPTFFASSYLRQESCAIAKMTAQCALYMGALKIFGTP